MAIVDWSNRYSIPAAAYQGPDAPAFAAHKQLREILPLVQSLVQEKQRKKLLASSGLTPEEQALATAFPEQAGSILASKRKASMKSTPMATTVYRNPETGELSDVAQEGWTPYQTTQDRALMRLSAQTAQSGRTKALENLVGVRRQGIQAHQRDILAKTTNLPLQQIKTLTQNNIRADRALQVLSEPNVTWQRLNFAITDLSAMMQGGVPHVDQLKASMFPNWKAQVAQWQTYATGNPTANVPQPIKQEVMRMIQEVKNVDNQYLQQSQKTQEDILGPTIDNFSKVKPIIERGTQEFMKGGVSEKSGISGRTFNSVGEAEKANLPKGTRIMINGRPAVIE